MKPDETHQLVKLQTSVKVIKHWMSDNFSPLNTWESLYPTTATIIHNLDGITQACRTTHRNLAVIFHQEVSSGTSCLHKMQKSCYFLAGLVWFFIFRFPYCVYWLEPIGHNSSILAAGGTLQLFSSPSDSISAPLIVRVLKHYTALLLVPLLVFEF